MIEALLDSISVMFPCASGPQPIIERDVKSGALLELEVWAAKEENAAQCTRLKAALEAIKMSVDVRKVRSRSEGSQSVCSSVGQHCLHAIIKMHAPSRS